MNTEYSNLSCRENHHIGLFPFSGPANATRITLYSRNAGAG